MPRKNPAPAAAVNPAPKAGAKSPDLARLEASLARVRHECAILMLEAAPHARTKYSLHRLPPAAQLAPVAGLAPITEATPQSPHTSPAAPASARDPLPFHLAPPLATERLQPKLPRRQPNPRLRGALYILIASLIAGSIGYGLAGINFSAIQAAHAALAAVAGK